MDDNTFRMMILLLACSLIIVFVYTSWRSRVKLRQVRALPSLLQEAGLHVFSDPDLHESYRFLPAFKNNLSVEKTLYAATGQEVTVFAYSESRASRRSYPILVLAATLPYALPAICIFTRSTRFGPITPPGHHIHKTNVASLDEAYRITAASALDAQSFLTQGVQQFLMRNTDIPQIEIAQNTIALFTSDNRFFQLTTISGIPSPEVFHRRLAQLHELQHILQTQSFASQTGLYD